MKAPTAHMTIEQRARFAIEHQDVAHTPADLREIIAGLLKGIHPIIPVRYCHQCGSIGEVDARFISCCPDGASATYVHPKVAEQARQGGVARPIHEVDIYDFAGWLTTRPGCMDVGSSHDAAPMAEAVGEYIRTFPEVFAKPAQAIDGKGREVELLGLRVVENPAMNPTQVAVIEGGKGLARRCPRPVGQPCMAPDCGCPL